MCSMVRLFLSQDQELEELKQRINTLTSQNEQLQATVTQQVSQIQQHKDQYNLLKVQLGRLHGNIKSSCLCKDVVISGKLWQSSSRDSLVGVHDMIKMTQTAFMIT